MKDEKIDFDFLFERGFIPTCRVGVGTIIYNKWGFEIKTLGNCDYCRSDEYGNIQTKGHLIDIEKQLNIDQTPIMTKMSVDELKALIPVGYTYILDERKEYVKSESQLSDSHAKGRYKMMKGEELISEGYNDETEDYFLCHSLLFVLEKENLLPKNLK